jgi:uncharacterized protein YndB with AHSA1/START domain
MHIHRRTLLDCPPSAVWRCLTEFDLQQRWITQLVEEIPDDPGRVGLGAVSTLRMREGNRVVTYRSVVTAWEPGRRLALRLSGGSFSPGMQMDVAYDLSPSETGTVLEYDVQVPLKGIVFKLMAPIIWFVAASNAKRDLTKLRSLAPTIARAP